MAGSSCRSASDSFVSGKRKSLHCTGVDRGPGDAAAVRDLDSAEGSGEDDIPGIEDRDVSEVEKCIICYIDDSQGRAAVLAVKGVRPISDDITKRCIAKCHQTQWAAIVRCCTQTFPVCAALLCAEDSGEADLFFELEIRLIPTFFRSYGIPIITRSMAARRRRSRQATVQNVSATLVGGISRIEADSLHLFPLRCSRRCAKNDVNIAEH